MFFSTSCVVGRFPHPLTPRLAEIEERFTRTYDVRDELRAIEEVIGVNPAIIYTVFPTPANPPSDDGHLYTAAQPKKLALLVGIDNYKYVNDLQGAVNDVANIKSLLVERFDFPDDEDHIHVLLDGQATRQNIINGIKEHLIAKAEKDSIVVFHYSGHGSQRTDDSGDEIDGIDETLVPVDSGREDPFPNMDITDDEINAWLGELTNKTPNVTFIFDSGHSGSAVRGAGLARTAKPDLRPRPPSDVAIATEARAVSDGKSSIRPEGARYTLISGSAAQELSRELNVNGEHHGAMTWNLVHAIRNSGADGTYRDIMDLVKTRVSVKFPSQHPQLEGPGEDQLVFSAHSRAAVPYILVNRDEGSGVTLAAGQVHGVTKQSIYAVYAPGENPFDSAVKPIAKIEVDRIDMVSATAHVVEGEFPPDASRAVELEHNWPSNALRVYVDNMATSDTLQKVATELQEFKHITRVESTDDGYDLLLREDNDQAMGKRFIVTEGADPTEISPRVAITDADAVNHVVKQVEHWAKWFNVSRINHQNPNLAVKFELKTSTDGNASTSRHSDKDVHFTFTDGEKFTVSVTNNSSKRLYIAVLDLSEDGSVDVLYPVRGAQEFVAPNKTWEKPLEAFVPSGRKSVRDVLKLIATTSYTDFNFLKQEAVRGGGPLSPTHGNSRNPLEELLGNAAVGTTRGARPIEVKGWTTADRVFEVRTKS